MTGQTRNITIGRTTIELDKGRQGWALPGRQITKDRERAKRAAVVINLMTEGAK